MLGVSTFLRRKKERKKEREREKEKERNKEREKYMFVAAENFIRSLIEKYGKHSVSTHRQMMICGIHNKPVLFCI